MENRPTAAIAGAGLSGLTAAYRLHQAGWDVRVFEAEPIAGGRVATHVENGYRADLAATTVPIAFRAYRALAAELGIEIIEGPSGFGVFKDGVIHMFDLDRPLRSGLRTEILSWGSKLRVGRLAFDVARAKARGKLVSHDLRVGAELDTESIREYSHRVLNADVDMYLCEPVSRAMQIADSDKVTKVELFIALGKLLHGALGCTAGGQIAMIDTLVDRVGGVELSTPVLRAIEEDAGVHVSYGEGETEVFDACVVACPLPQAAAICPDHQALAPMVDRFRYMRTLSVAIGTTRAPDTSAFMIQLPRAEDAEVVMVFLDHAKAPDRAPPGHGLFGVTWEWEASEAWWARSDEEIVARTLETIVRLFPEVEGTVDFSHVKRWGIALPSYPTGSVKLMAELHERLDPDARIQFAGDYMTETGQDSCVVMGTAAAGNLERVRASGREAVAA